MTFPNSVIDPVMQALPHLYFYKEGNKVIGKVNQDSHLADTNFRSFAYDRADVGKDVISSDAKTGIAMEFYERYIAL